MLAGCSARAPGASPTGSIAAESVQQPSAEPSSWTPTASPPSEPATPTDVPVSSNPPRPTAAPAFRCSAYDPAEHRDFALLTSDDYRIWVEPEITALERADTGASLLAPRPAGRGWWQQFLLGGQEARFEVGYPGDDTWPSDSTITSLSARLVDDAQSRQELDVRFEPKPDGGSVAVVSVPEARFRGTLKLSIEWRDECFLAAGRSSIPIIIDPPSTLEGCPEGTNRAWDEVGALFDAPVTVGGVPVGLLPLPNGKVAALPVIDPLPPYVAFGSDTPAITTSPGATIDVSVPIATALLAYLLGRIEGGWIHGEEPAADVVFRSVLVENAERTFSFSVPSEPGRYAIEAIFDYDATCTFGTAGFVVGVDIE